MVDRLTAEQEALLPVKRDEWLRVGLATGPANREKAERGVCLAYAAAGLPEPEMIIWLSSPLEGAIGAEMLAQVWDQVRAQVGAQVRAQVGAQVWNQVRDQVRDQVGAQVRAQVGAQVGDQVWNQVRDQVGAQVGAQVGDQVWDQVRAQVGAQVRAQVGAQVGDQVWNQVWNQVWDQVWNQVRDQVGAQVGDQVGDQVRDQVRAQVGVQVGAQVWAQVGDQVGDQVGAQVWDAVFGQHESGLLSFYDYFAAELECVKPFEGVMLVARNAGWWWPFANAVILTERPVALHRDPEYRLHNEHGMAIEYPDGFGIWAINGVRVNERIVMRPETLTVEEITNEENAEVRRVMRQQYGYDKYLDGVGAELVDDDPEWGKLWRAEIKTEEEPLCLVEVVNSTPEPDGSFKNYFLRVPPDKRTAHDAIAWTFTDDEGEALTADTYTPLVQT